jgi:16S rRNA (cytidine1402-2'-O)-methyltransferase
MTGWRETPGILVLFEAPHRLRATLEALARTLGNRHVVVAHELTKLHESWHRGPLDKLIIDKDLPSKGEFTILVGPAPEPPEGQDAVALEPEQVGAEFGRMTENGGMTRRDAIAELARRHGLRKRQVYSMVEAAKHSGE